MPKSAEKFESKSLNSPEEVRKFDKGKVELTRMGDALAPDAMDARLDLTAAQWREVTARALAVFRRGRHVERIAAHAEADDLCIDSGASSLGVLEVLEQHRAGAVAHHEAVAILVPRPARTLRIVIAQR